MRFPAVVLATLLLSACGPKQISLVDVGPKPAEPLAESEGAVLVEVIHAIGQGGNCWRLNVKAPPKRGKARFLPLVFVSAAS